MLQRLQQSIVLFILLLVVVKTSAFSIKTEFRPLLRSSPSSRISPSPSILNAGAVIMGEQSEYESNEFLVSRATACMHSESCSLEEAESYLNEMLLVQNNHSDDGNTMAGSQTTVCAAIIEGLNQRIEARRKQISVERTVVHVVNVLAGIYVVSAICHDIGFASALPVDSPVLSSSLGTAIAGRTSESSAAATALYQDWLYSY
eukprot:CAMPEP_0197173664 /NCGR_PEP_ID=MMETSP1423-20130617/510_1 /TAXON_ID=476441 /ORGANISM="Pseudo-nitzschia heimii, Strain UNC1101" /LENGTH=202 /DNA_ID=CAMNT_0042622509 /DNA_START=56 /DNA_END=664 /DNA_ORIENTATION=+